MEKLLFREFFLEAWRATTKKSLPWIFGAVIGIASILETKLDIIIPETVTPDTLTDILTQQTPSEWVWVCLSLALLWFIGIFGRSNLIPALSFVTGKKDLPNHPNTLPALWANFLRGLCLEGVLLLAILLFTIPLSLPFWLASSRNPEAMSPLTILAILTLIPIIIILFFIRQYAFLYSLLSPIGIRGAFEASAKLFSRYMLPSLLFGIFAFILTFLFTFSLNLAILSVSALATAISIPPEKIFLSLILGGVFFAWFAIFQQTLWMVFFRTIAKEENREKSVPEKTTSFIENNKVPDVPPVQ